MKKPSNSDIQRALKNTNINVEELKKASQSGRVEDYINKNLSKQASDKLKQILSDKDATQKLMSTPQARELLNKLMEK